MAEITEKQFWCQAWLAVATSANCTIESTPSRWANNAVKDYKKRYGEFPKEVNKNAVQNSQS